MTRLQTARLMRHNPTRAEHALWQEPRAARLGGCKFRRQLMIGRYIVDFVCFGAGLVIEVDGGQHAERLGYDAQRTAWLEAQGFLVLRSWNNEVLGNVEAVKVVIAEALEGRPPLPGPPPQRGEGTGGVR